VPATRFPVRPPSPIHCAHGYPGGRDISRHPPEHLHDASGSRLLRTAAPRPLRAAHRARESPRWRLRTPAAVAVATASAEYLPRHWRRLEGWRPEPDWETVAVEATRPEGRTRDAFEAPLPAQVRVASPPSRREALEAVVCGPDFTGIGLVVRHEPQVRPVLFRLEDRWLPLSGQVLELSASSSASWNSRR